MNENDYLEQVNELKKQYDELENSQKPLRRQHDLLQRNFFALYGSIRLLNLLIQSSHTDICPQITNQIELLNMFSEDFYNTIMNIKAEDQDDLYEPIRIVSGLDEEVRHLLRNVPGVGVEVEIDVADIENV